MSIDPSLPAPPRHSSRRILLPTLLMLGLAVAWSGFWVFASRQAEARLDAFLAEQGSKGRVIACARRTLGGYPFRLELRCTEPRMVVTREDGTVTLAAKDFVAVAQVYDPMRVIAESSGPLTVTPIGDRGPLQASWTSAEASFQFALSGPERVDLVVDGLDVSETVDGGVRALVGGARFEAHSRLSEGAGAAAGSHDVVARIDAADLPPVDAVLGDPARAKIEFQGTVTGLTDLGPKPLEERLRDWSAAGGVLKIALLQVDRGETSAKASGTVGLDAEGHPAGTLEIALAGVGALTKSLKRSGIAPKSLVNVLGFGLSVLGKPTNIDGRPAVEVPLAMSDGRATIGAFPAGDTPRFF